MSFNPIQLLALPPRIARQSYTQRDTILYALGVGAGQTGAAEELRFVYEDGLEALPTMAVVLAYPGFWQKEPEYEIDWKRVLHAGQSVSFHAPLPVAGEVRGELMIDSIIDKGAGKGALLYSTRRVFDTATDAQLATVRQVSFLRGDGGAGGSSDTQPAPFKIPNRAADDRVSVSTRPEQALIYRLSGDYNPLHADPQVAAEAGLPGPILHGLCSYGMVGRVLLNRLCGNHPARMKRLDCRFTSPVFPGEEIEVSIWKLNAGRAGFQARVTGRDLVVLDNGYVEFEG
jgi:acyl dehydratase